VAESRVSRYLNEKFLHANSSGISNIPALDGIRGIAILMVVSCHLFAHSVPGGQGIPLGFELFGARVNIQSVIMSGANGVRLFFMLSGFLLFLPYAKAHAEGGRVKGPIAFYKRRLARILPGFYFFTALYCLAVMLAGAHEGSSPFNPVNIIFNALLLQPFMLFLKDVTPDLIPGTWSLAAECMFYAALPLVAARLRAAKMTAAFCIAVAACAYGARLIAHAVFGPAAPFGVVHNFFTHADLFALGMLLAMAYARKPDSPLRGGWAVVLVIAGAASYILLFIIPGLSFPGYETIVALSFFCIMAGAVFSDGAVRRVFEAWPLRFIGIISYSMFVSNIIIAWYVLEPMRMAFGISSPLQALAFNLTVGMAVVVLASTVTYVFIERPFLVRRAATAVSPAAA
jgi:peptidoglycan/LPS O-acetylase OafA/YrhL